MTDDEQIPATPELHAQDGMPDEYARQVQHVSPLVLPDPPLGVEYTVVDHENATVLVREADGTERYVRPHELPGWDPERGRGG